jgi:hypothetical protein
MNNVAIVPYLFMHALQIQNVKRNTTKKVTINESNNQEIVYDQMEQISEIKQMSLAVEQASAIEETAEVGGLIESEASSSLLNEITMGSEILLS